MRTFVISDVHGGYKALKVVLEKANFDFEHDKLICLGDVNDGWPEVKECFDLILKIKNLVYIWGNHDIWAYEYYATTRKHKDNAMEDNPWEEDYMSGQYLMNKSEYMCWERQGGKGTMKSFGQQKMPIEVVRLLDNAKNYYIDNNRVFVHGGFNTDIDINLQDRHSLAWNRELIQEALHCKVMHEKHGHKEKLTEYDEVFIGHTPVMALSKEFHDKVIPIYLAGVWCIDTGASYDGPLTLMQIDEKLEDGTYPIFQSEPVNIYYPGIKARG